MLFGQFVGSWDFELVELTGQGEVAAHGEWHFGWILRGLGIQDVWIVPSRHSSPDPNGVMEYGTTIRIYDPTTDVWHVSWNGPHRLRFVQLEGGRDGHEILLIGSIGSQPTRWVFSDIGRSSFTWRNELSFDGGKSFLVVQHLTARRWR